MLICSREVGQLGSSTFEAAQIIPISEHLKEPFLTFGREVGQLGSSAFEAAQIFPISEYSKEPMLTFRREVGLAGSFTCHGQAEGALRAVVQEAAVVAFLQWRPRCGARARQHGSCLRRAGWACGV